MLADVPGLFHLLAMGRISLESINDFARRGYQIRVTCGACGHQSEWHPLLLMRALSRKGHSMRVEAAERRLTCGQCKASQAKITPILPSL